MATDATTGLTSAKMEAWRNRRIKGEPGHLYLGGMLVARDWTLPRNSGRTQGLLDATACFACCCGI
jgi:hypothetical protein